MSTTNPPLVAGNPRKIMPRDWLDIVALAEAGKPPREIAKQYGVDLSVIYKGLKKRRVNLTVAAQRALAEEAERSKADTLKRIKETKDTEYTYLTYLQREAMRIVTETAKATPPGQVPNYGSILNAAKALKITVETIKLGGEAKWRLLGLDRENENADVVLPELPISEMTDGEVAQMREQQEMEDGLEPGELEALVAKAGDDEDPEDEEIVTEGEDDEP